jgi:hypothetical protein
MAFRQAFLNPDFGFGAFADRPVGSPGHGIQETLCFVAGRRDLAVGNVSYASKPTSLHLN